MAKKKGGNKSAAIREYLDQNPGAKPTEIVNAMASQGFVVTAQYVSTIKTKYMNDGPPKRRGRPAGKTTVRKATRRGRPPKKKTIRKSTTASTGGYEDLIAAKKLVDQLGSVENARAALAALEKITG